MIKIDKTSAEWPVVKYKLADIAVSWRNGQLRVVPAGSANSKKDFSPIQNLFVMLAESDQSTDPEQAFNELMKVEEFRDVVDDSRFRNDFGDILPNPRSKGYRPCEVYRMLVQQLKKAKHTGMADTQIKEWFDGLEPKLPTGVH